MAQSEIKFKKRKSKGGKSFSVSSLLTNTQEDDQLEEEEQVIRFFPLSLLSNLLSSLPTSFSPSSLYLPQSYTENKQTKKGIIGGCKVQANNEEEEQGYSRF